MNFKFSLNTRLSGDRAFGCEMYQAQTAVNPEKPPNFALPLQRHRRQRVVLREVVGEGRVGWLTTATVFKTLGSAIGQ
jgi:hypothetical protein